ncbi:heavy metal-binding domain-containing protein [Leuconostoc citreum]|uniref:heavy metal-binding domain-containing protein n=1 Tax=Leuconostoc citreum TaxID=33964 RepID=UPI0032DFA560
MFSTKDIVEVKEAVFSEQVLSVNIVKDAISGIKGIFGGANLIVTQKNSAKVEN